MDQVVFYLSHPLAPWAAGGLLALLGVLIKKPKLLEHALAVTFAAALLAVYLGQSAFLIPGIPPVTEMIANFFVFAGVGFAIGVQLRTGFDWLLKHRALMVLSGVLALVALLAFLYFNR